MYTYDDAGNQLTKAETVNRVENVTASFVYDALNRLSTAEERDVDCVEKVRVGVIRYLHRNSEEREGKHANCKRIFYPERQRAAGKSARNASLNDESLLNEGLEE